MADELKPGDHVEWDTSQGTTEGTVERKLTSETRIKGFTAKASKENPEYLVKSAKTGAKAAHKPGELRKKGGAAKGAAKKSAAKQSTAKKTAVKKTAAKKSATKKATAKKATAKRSTAKKATTKRSTAKKSAAKKSARR